MSSPKKKSLSFSFLWLCWNVVKLHSFDLLYQNEPRTNERRKERTSVWVSEWKKYVYSNYYEKDDRTVSFSIVAAIRCSLRSSPSSRAPSWVRQGGTASKFKHKAVVDDVGTGVDRDFFTVSTTHEDVYEWCSRFPAAAAAATTTTKSTRTVFTEESAWSIQFLFSSIV